jgi:hypothetical protein
MADREKLIELLCEAKSKSADDAWFSDATYAEQLAMEADHLIANGVTVQKWIPVTERLPQEDVRVLVWLTDGVNSYTKMDTDRRHNNRWVRWGMYVTHWMPLPTPPKGE